MSASEIIAQPQPYRDPSVGDIIIRTSNNIEFHVHRRRLSDASPVFADMFTLPNVTAETEDKPEVAVSETSAVWEKLLPFCYLAEEPSITLDDIPRLLEAGRKYQIVAVTWLMRAYIFRSDFLDQKPYAVYALACMAGIPHAATLAARRTLATSIYPDYAKEFAYVSGIAMYNLLDYRRRCGIAASDVVAVTNSNEVPKWMQSSAVLPDMKTCDHNPMVVDNPCALVKYTVYDDIGIQFVRVRKSFISYMERLHEVLKLRPDSSLASSPYMLNPVIASALECKTCASKIYERTTRCAKVLESKIEEALSKASTKYY